MIRANDCVLYLPDDVFGVWPVRVEVSGGDDH